VRDERFAERAKKVSDAMNAATLIDDGRTAPTLGL
jgi:hypothetical protein